MRADELDALFGDPLDAGNPVGQAAVFAADERQEMLAEAERRLDAIRFNAEFVPAAYGGSLTRADRLAEVLRAVWRHDPSLGLGYGFSSFIATVNVWSSGNEDQRRATADLLLANGKIAAGFNELAHGNDLGSAEFAGRRAGGGWLLSGRKEVVSNLRRGAAVVLLARTSDAAGSRSHSQFLVTKDEVPAGRLRDLPRFTTSGLRGVQLGGMEFADCPVPDGALIGEPGQGMEIALRSYQTTRALVPAIAVGPLDSALRTTLACALDRRLYGGVVADIPYVRSVLARSYADLLTVDTFTSVVLRALHLVPEAMPLYSAAVKYLASRVVVDAFGNLRSVLGANAYVRQGRYAIFQKLARDIAPATFAHASRPACLVMILPQLPRLARRSWPVADAAMPGLFELGGGLPPLRLDNLVTGMTRRDVVVEDLMAGTPDTGPVGRFVAHFQREVRALGEDCAQLAPSELTIAGAPATFALADRYTVLLAAASILAVWRENPGSVAETALLAMLDRLTDHLGGAVLSTSERDAVEQDLFQTAVERYRENRLFDLTARRLPGDTPIPTQKATSP